MLERSRPSRSEDRTHAYLMLLRIEVAAFHLAMPDPKADPTPRSHRGGVHLATHPHCKLVSVALVLVARTLARGAPDGR